MEWKIGNVSLKNRLVLAPMAGISNPAYMKICEEMGIGYAITELISSEAIIRGNQKTFDMLNGIEDLRIPVAVQLFGANPKVMGEAAKIIVDRYKVPIIDINMGCPVPKVSVRAGAGSCLMRDKKLAYSIVKSVVESVNVPVTVKIRSGWDFSSINAVEIAQEIERAGASCITVHPRTRSQGYSGKSDWNIIKKVKENVRIPVIGNGDVKSPLDVYRMLDETGCDAVMIGRALLGNPWLIQNTISYFNQEEVKEVSLEEKVDMCLKHIEYLRKYKPDKIVALEIRNPIAWYLKGNKSFSNLREKLYKTHDICDIIFLLKEYKEEFCYGKK
ncbi:MAG: tRNA dihydrouridine synthase DusB [Bacilli bacterium]|nr:tRNA dihydrouridine synthase DusB [Bacilli bacterium]